MKMQTTSLLILIVDLIAIFKRHELAAFKSFKKWLNLSDSFMGPIDFDAVSFVTLLQFINLYRGCLDNFPVPTKKQ